jgi:hypothetical protein
MFGCSHDFMLSVDEVSKLNTWWGILVCQSSYIVFETTAYTSIKLYTGIVQYKLLG